MLEDWQKTEERQGLEMYLMETYDFAPNPAQQYASIWKQQQATGKPFIYKTRTITTPEDYADFIYAMSRNFSFPQLVNELYREVLGYPPQGGWWEE